VDLQYGSKVHGSNRHRRRPAVGAEKEVVRVLKIDPANDLAMRFLPIIGEEMRK
jgi:hypothetical protein